ncbi:MAG: hypothetical protein ACRD0C_11640 [Acidimicrobiia bacterium]
MRRRSIVLLAGGVLAVALAPPVFGAGDSTTPPPGGSAAPTTTTTAPYTSATTATTATTTTTAPAPAGSGMTTTTTAPAGSAAPTTTTTAPATDSAAPSGDCPGNIHSAAPAEGESEIFPAGDAGEVEVARTSATELEIVDAVASDGWTAEITTPTGPRVKARFIDDANSSSKVRFAAQMDEAGEEIHVRVSCS